VQYGSIRQFSPIVITLFFHNIPWWICALDTERILSLQFPQFTSFDDLIGAIRGLDQGHCFVSILSTFDRSKFKFSPTLLKEDLVLICGPIDFFTSLWQNHSYPQSWIFCSDSYKKLRFLPDFPFRLHRIHHFHHGGPTKFEMLWSASDELSFPIQKLSRTIGDFLDYSVRPLSCQQSPSFKHFTSSSVLPIQGISSPIVYQTHFSSTGFGFRALVASELSLVFGVPAMYVPFFRLEDFPFPPIQILDSLLSSWSDLRLDPLPKMRKVDFCVPTPRPVSDSAPVFLPELNKTMPATWTLSAPAADKAAKADDAQVAIAMWNNRILSL